MSPHNGSRREGGRRSSNNCRQNQPLVTIVAVVYQARLELIPLMDSIFANTADETEIIVIDGGSSDGTCDLLERWGDRIDYWLSEKDAGIYDAMNKGLDAATGEYVLHLNAGDRLRCIPREKLLTCQAENIDVVCFQVLIDGGYVYRPRVGFILRIDNSWHHQGTFYRRECHPHYDPSFRVFGDFDANQKLYLGGCSVRIYQEIVAENSTLGISSSGMRRDEIYQIIRKNFGMVYLPIAFTRFQLNRIRRFLVGAGRRARK